MKNFFMSKKQKQLMRERRRKKKRALAADGTEHDAPKDRPSSKKRPRPSEPAAESVATTKAVDHASKEKFASKAATCAATDSSVVVVPAHLSSQQAKTFRKHTRRQARAEGRDETQLQFLVEGSKELQEHESNNNKTKKRRKQRDFPNINQLVQESKQEKQRQAAAQARKEAEDALSAAYKAKYIAMDCEMVGIGTDGKQSALARVSLTDWYGKTVLDTFVQVPTRVTDFRTWVSGVKPKDIQEASQAMELDKCRKTVANLLKDKVVVGHALKNDFHSLLLSHPVEHIRDTAKYRRFQRFGGNKWRPRKLRDLVKENLDLETFQQEGQSHDSVEDARAAMELFKLAREAWEQDLANKAKKKKR